MVQGLDTSVSSETLDLYNFCQAASGDALWWQQGGNAANVASSLCFRRGLQGSGFVLRMNCWSDFLGGFHFFGSRWRCVQLAVGGRSLGTTDRCFGRGGLASSHPCGSKLFSRCF